MTTHMEDVESSCDAKTRQRHVCVDDFRQHCESNKQWFARRQFIIKHVEEYEAKDNVDQLLSLSMVWVNHVFMGCRYGQDLMKRVLEMAEGIDAAEAPSFQLVSRDASKKLSSSNHSQEPVRKMSKFGRHVRFKPVHFVSGSATDDRETKCVGEISLVTPEDSNPQDAKDSSQDQSGEMGCSALTTLAAASLQEAGPYVFDPWVSSGVRDTQTESVGGLSVGSCDSASPCTVKTNCDHLAKNEEHMVKQCNLRIMDSRLHEGTYTGLDTIQQEAPLSSEVKVRAFSRSVKDNIKEISIATLQKKQNLISRLSSFITADVKDLPSTERLNYSFIFTKGSQSCKVNPEYIYVSMKHILPGELPKNKGVPYNGYACELRCQDVYLATGFSMTKKGAREEASQQAVKLLLHPVEVRSVQREHKCMHVCDVIVCQVGSPTPQLVPAFSIPWDRLSPSTSPQPKHCRQWANFMIMGDTQDAVSILKNSATLNNMEIKFKCGRVPGRNIWQCSVYLENELLASAQGKKKAATHWAAEEALLMLRREQAGKLQGEGNKQDDLREEQRGNLRNWHGGIKQPNELVILENSNSAICIINNTAQFNKIAVDYRFTQLLNTQWKCEIFLAGHFLAEGVGSKKSAKHLAANEALTQLKQTHAVVKLNQHKIPDADSVSRDQIMGRVTAEHLRQEIKEDNVGNLMLRKMGWTGGGLGREGKGIDSPVNIKEHFNRQGLGLDSENPSLCLSTRDLEGVVRAYASSDRQDDLRFTAELDTNERKQIHKMCHKYGLRSKSFGKGTQRFLLVSRKMQKEQLIGHLLQEGEVGKYELVRPHASHYTNG